MRRLIGATIAAAAIFTIAPAEAREGCGPGYHRGPAGHCRPNVGNRNETRLVIGNFYTGRGYWDGRRYYQHRVRHNNGWRYR